ncbi:McrB family protein [Kocuria sp. CH-021]|uniref:McrB family protein n=1 Tax=Kocuria sp. CH-021 TaxID=3406735 RepID=UPI003C787FFD
MWTVDHVEWLRQSMTGKNADLSPRDFYTKLDDQLEQLAREHPDRKKPVARLLVEMLHLFYAYNVDVSATRTNRRLEFVYDACEYTPQERQMAESSPWITQGIGRVGMAQVQLFDCLCFLMDLTTSLKQENNQSEVEQMFLEAESGWRDFVRRIESLSEGRRDLMVYYTVPHLIYPDYIEDSSTQGHRQRIVAAYDELLPKNSDDLNTDEKLWEIRSALVEQQLIDDPALSFYDEPLASGWGRIEGEDEAFSDMLAGLEFKQQIILYGPPGTSKSHDAKQLSRALIQRERIASIGAVAYLKERRIKAGNQSVDDIYTSYVHELQMHPTFAYEDFIGGWQFRDGATKFIPGFLPRLVNRINDMNQASTDEGRKPIPHVLILDEINRVDLSRAMGEAFTLLDGRGNSVIIPAPSPETYEEEGYRLSLPENLYIIGTMNEIDQSLELVDYAMRRRFLWFECTYSPERLHQIIRHRWDNTDTTGRRQFSRVEAAFTDYVAACSLLNQRIRESPVLGRDYVIGQTVFGEIVYFVGKKLSATPQTSTPIWTTKDEAAEPVQRLWDLSIRPLLKEYLRSADPDSRDRTVDELGATFLRRPVS